MIFGMRVNDTLAAITEPWFLGVDGTYYVRQLRRALESTSIPRRAGIENALSLGAHAPPAIASPQFKDRAVATARQLVSPVQRVQQRDGSTNVRRAKRACMLAEIVMRGRPVGSVRPPTPAPNPNVRLLDALITSFKHWFPASDMYMEANRWTEAFTDPRRHNPANFRYIVHAIRLGEGPVPGSNVPFTPATRLLEQPEILRSWTAISCSVIDERRKHTFRPCGLILEVPPDNILVTATHDVGFRNHAGTIHPENASPARLLEIQGSLLEEIRSKNAQHTSTSPERILEGTGDIRASRPYNEIVVTGRSLDRPELVFVKVIGLFLQEAEATPAQRQQMETAAAARTLPLVRL